MPQFKDEKDVARFLLCSSILEGRVASAYKHMSDRVENQQVKSLLTYIFNDTSKHAAILRSMSDDIMKLELTTGDCEKTWGKAWKKLVLSSMDELSQKEKVKDTELVGLIDEMISLENFFGENYLTILHLKTLKLVAKQRCVDLGSFSTILEWIVEDERRHEQTLKIIKNLVTKPR